MTYTLDESFNSRNYTPAASVAAVFGYARNLSAFTIHHWGNKGQRYEVVRDYLCTNSAPTSAHFVVEDGRAACIVSPVDAAWHAGNGQGNAQTIGLECRPEATAGDYETIAALISDLRAIYGDLPLRPHSSWTSTACPGDYDLAKLDRMARAVTAGTSVPVDSAPFEKPAQKPSKRKTYGADEIHWTVEAGDTLYSIAGYYNNIGGAQAIADYNGVKAENLIIGERIWIPGQLAWTIEAPDEIRTIAAHYAVDPTWLAEYNGLPHADATIYVGNTLWIRK